MEEKTSREKFSAQDYTYKVFWSEADSAWIGTASEFKSLSFIDEKDQFGAFAGIVGLVGETLDEMYSDGEEPPVPFSKQEYSGRFALRMTPEQHRRLAEEAAEMGVSMNHLVVSRI